MILRKYQTEAVKAIESGWNEFQKQLLVLPTGCGKTIVFSTVAQDRAEDGRVLILAHRDELIEQARDKYHKLTGNDTAKEKAEETCVNSQLPVVVGSVQTMMRDSRLARFSNDYFKTVIVDEAHHVLSDSYQKILNHFGGADVLGVTATPDRGDKKELGKYFDRLAYEYNLRDAIQDGYLCSISAKTIPLEIDMNSVKVRAGDFDVDSVSEVLEPLLPQIAETIAKNAADRKTVVFAPLISVAKMMCDLLNACGIETREVNGMSPDRKETLQWFDEAGRGVALCNAMLLTEGWDCPSVDCIVVLRPTKIRSLYTQMIGRGTRICEGKDNLLLLDFLWLSQKHNLCKPANLVVDKEEDVKFVTDRSKDKEIDLFGAASDAEEARKSNLAKQLKAQSKKQSKVINPTEWFISLGRLELEDYEPCFAWELDPATETQKAILDRAGLDSFGLSKGEASTIISVLFERKDSGLATPKQVLRLQQAGYRNPETWTFDQASEKIGELAAVKWKPWKLRTRPEVFSWT